MKHFLLMLLVSFCAASVQAQGGNFGLTVGVGDHEVFVGQPASTASPGAIHLFQRAADGQAWSLSATLTASDATPGDGFGRSFVVNGSRMVVGAPDHAGGAGAVYVFERAPEGWTQTHRLSVAAIGKIGTSVATSGDVIVAGAPDTSAVIVFRKDAGDFQVLGALRGSDTKDGDGFGAAVATDGERIYVGAPGHKERAGAIYVFGAAEGAYVEEVKLESAEDHKALGRSLWTSSSGPLYATAPGASLREMRADSLGRIRLRRPFFTGELLAFGRNVNGEWTQQTAGPKFEDAILKRRGSLPFSISGERMLVGSPEHRVVRVFQRDETSGMWSQTGTVAGDDRGFGMILALHGRTGVVSALEANYEEGAALVLSLDDAQPTVEARLNLHSEMDLVAGGSARCEDGMAWQFGCHEVDLVSFLPIAALGGEDSVELNDVWGWTDPETGQEYALVGRTDGTAFVDITDPAHPVYLGDLPLTQGAEASSWRDIKVYSDHAFIVADASGDHGMQVFDLTQLRSASAGPTTFTESGLYDGISSAHNIVINEESGFAYAVGSSSGGQTCGRGLHFINIQDPLHPTFAGCFTDDAASRRGAGYTHDAQCVLYQGPDLEHRGKEICFSSNASVLSIADVTDKEHPAALSQAIYPNVAYAHQGWLTEDHAHFFMNDELDELRGAITGTRTLIWDVADLDDPQLLHEFFADNTASDHNLYIKGDLMYQSNYLSGLRILDISDVARPVEVGFFDTVSVVPDRPGFFGSWSNYPYFESGSIIVSSINEGLFVVKKRRVDS